MELYWKFPYIDTVTTLENWEELYNSFTNQDKLISWYGMDVKKVEKLNNNQIKKLLSKLSWESFLIKL